MNLTCDYDPEDGRIYQVKWYKDYREFYSYAPGRPGRTFHISGVKVNEPLSGAKHVILDSVDLATEGQYVCEVTVDGSFDTVIGTGNVTVVEVPQSGPEITGEYRSSMEEGDHVRINCTSYRSRPAATLTWYINGARSDNSSLTRYRETSEPSGLRTATLGLDFRLRQAHFSLSGQVVLKCTAEIESVSYQSEDVHISSLTLPQRMSPGADQREIGNQQSSPKFRAAVGKGSVVRAPLLLTTVNALLCILRLPGG
ncbi:cell adhesion molecule 3-like isoform X2 [Pollicipes pollicipes]|uniref:cell adhesion molecule 3-like isoform X2 n=1 Tax=Pollicipes pollicipes TaxID=41117 RepID=UPI001884F9B7|nr:cell adhesion molecule 3-like isoform X2 [Pollicipes pollicipes]